MEFAWHHAKGREHKRRVSSRGSHPKANLARCCITSVSNYLQVVQALLKGADKVGDLLVLEGQRVGDLTQRLLGGEERHWIFKPARAPSSYYIS